VIGPVPPNRATHLEAFLLQEPMHHLLALGLLAEQGPGRFLACVLDGALAGVVYAGPDGLVVPAAIQSRAAALELGEALRDRPTHVVFGERMAVGQLLGALGAPRLQGREEHLYAVTADDMGPYVTPELRRATEDDIPRLIELGEAYHEEQDLPPPPGGIEGRVRTRVTARRIWVIEQAGDLAFRVDIAAQSNHGAHVDVIYTAPAYRGRGFAGLGLGQLARSTLARLPRLTALAPENHPAAAAVVRKVGFGPALPWRRVDVPPRGAALATSDDAAPSPTQLRRADDAA
jgi:uncharacterized protein